MRKIVSLALVLTAITSVGFAQIPDPSFEASSGSTPMGWNSPKAGIGAVGGFSDGDFPCDGTRLYFLANNGTGTATPHSNPGGFGTDATGTACISVTFSLGSTTDTTIEGDAQLLSGEAVDFAEVSVTALGQTLNLYSQDGTAPASSATTFFPGLTVREKVSFLADLGAMFPGIRSTDDVTLTLHVGQGAGGSVNSRGYFDNFRLTPGTPTSEPQAMFVQTSPGVVTYMAQNPDFPNARCFNLISRTPGDGPFLGMIPDTLTFSIINQPLGVDPLHFLLNNGTYSFSFPAVALNLIIPFRHVLVSLNNDQYVGHTQGIDVLSAP